MTLKMSDKDEQVEKFCCLFVVIKRNFVISTNFPKAPSIIANLFSIANKMKKNMN